MARRRRDEGSAACAQDAAAGRDGAERRGAQRRQLGHRGRREVELLESIQRRAGRDLNPPEAVINVKRLIRDRFPEHTFED